MMYFKIARNNVKKSFKDYSIYFLTLMFAVCIFYSFNSLESQEAVLMLGSSQASYMELLGQLMGIISVFVSAILGGLILYGNNFLIKKRKKELGIYMTLGMAKRKIAGILLIETMLVGVVALGIGLGLGVVGSQGLSILTSRLFAVDMAKYTFVLSMDAIFKTIHYFTVIFIVVMLFNTVQLSKYALIDLLYAEKKNEKAIGENNKLTALVFGVSIVMLGIAYLCIEQAGLDASDTRFWVSAVLGCVGTFLYFKSLMSFIGGLVRRYENFYFRGLNSFVVRQMYSKVTTNVMSMTMICLMLFLTIGGLSTGFSFKNTMEKSLEATTPFDATFYVYHDEGEEPQNVEELLDTVGFQFGGTEKYSSYKEYRSEKNVLSLLGDAEIKGFEKFQRARLYMIPVSEYNALKEMMGQPQIVLDEKEVLLTSNQLEVIKGLTKYLESNETVVIEDVSYKVKDRGVQLESLASTGLNNNIMTVIVPDQLVDSRSPNATCMNIQYGKGDRDGSEMRFRELFKGYKEGSYNGQKIDYSKGFVSGSTKEELYAESQGLTAIVLFIGIYLGIIFLLASAAVLALQQLSEASDSRGRYQVLKKIGTPKKMIHQSIFRQTLIYFTLPLSLACIHAVVGIDIANDFIKMYGKPDIGAASVGTFILMVIIYGGYFYVTYMGYKNVVLNGEE